MKNSLQLKDGMTSTQIVGAYLKAVEDFKNQISRVPARDNSPKAVETYAKNLFKEVKHLIHPSFMEQYLVNYEQICEEREAEKQAFMKQVAKQRTKRK